MLAFPSENFTRVPRINRRRRQPQTHDKIILSKTHFGSKIWWLKRLYMFQILGLCVPKCIRRRSQDESHKDPNLISGSHELSNSIDIESWGGHISFSKPCWLLNLEFYKFIIHSPISFKHVYCFLGMFLDHHSNVGVPLGYLIELGPLTLTSNSDCLLDPMLMLHLLTLLSISIPYMNPTTWKKKRQRFHIIMKEERSLSTSLT